MAKESKISWTDATWNPWYGCHKKSPGCANCYMYRWADSFGRNPDVPTRAADRTFKSPLRWREPKVIFTCSLSDFFIREADKWRADAHAVMESTPQHTYLILTKEIDRAVKLGYVPPRNALLGVSAENQHWLDKRMPDLLRVSATGYFVSAEPLLGPLKLKEWLPHVRCVITGGESGGPEHRALVNKITSNHVWDRGKVTWVPKARALDMVTDILEQCERSGVALFHKQWGGPRPDSAGHRLRGKDYQSMEWARL